MDLVSDVKHARIAGVLISVAVAAPHCWQWLSHLQTTAATTTRAHPERTI